MACRSLKKPIRTAIPAILEYLTVESIIILNNLSDLYLVKIPGLLAWLIFERSVFEQKTLLSFYPIHSCGEQWDRGASPDDVIFITMGTHSFSKDESFIHPKIAQGLS